MTDGKALKLFAFPCVLDAERNYSQVAPSTFWLLYTGCLSASIMQYSETAPVISAGPLDRSALLLSGYTNKLVHSIWVIISQNSIEVRHSITGKYEKQDLNALSMLEADWVLEMFCGIMGLSNPQ